MKTQLIPAPAVTMDFIARIKDDIGLSENQALFFKYRARACRGQAARQWTMYTITEQMHLFSKLVLAYRRRHEKVGNALGMPVCDS
jgi:hypothetical protein